MNEKIYNCDKCFCKTYKTLNGLLKHKNKIHQNDHTITFNCSKCNKNFNCRQHKWRHEKKCNNTGNLFLMNEEIKRLSNKINQLENKSIIINNNSNNNNTINDNRKQFIINYSPGTEPIDHLTIDQQKDIMNEGLNCIMRIIKLTNFDENKPEFHSYCVTALNDKHINIIDVDTQKIIKTEKIELYDSLLNNNFTKLESICNNKLLSRNDREEFSDKLDRLKKLLFEKKRGMKKYYSQINLLSFNNKDQIIKTWDDIKKSLDNIINEENLIVNKDIDVSDEETNEYCKITYKNNTFILNDNKLYKINDDNTKGELYAENINGKIMKI
jgi:hypothetical protein